MTLLALLGMGAALLSYAGADLIRRHSLKLGFTDLPNSRSLHTTTTPRGGGAGFALAVPCATACAMYWRPAPSGAAGVLLIAAVALAAVGLADDRWGLPAGVRLLAQCVAALAVIGGAGTVTTVALPGGSSHALGALAFPVTLLWLVGLTNVYNFMDGIDGLAASQAIVAAVTIAVLGGRLGREDVANAMAILAAGVLGFLALNWAPARIFMGDAGSTFLGFILAGWAVLGGREGAHTVPVFAWIAVLSPFLFDALSTLARRAVRREPLHQAHRTHLYQLLVQSGWTHARTTLLYAALATSAGVFTMLHYGLHLIPAGVYLASILLPLATPLLLVSAASRRR